MELTAAVVLGVLRLLLAACGPAFGGPAADRPPKPTVVRTGEVGRAAGLAVLFVGRTESKPPTPPPARRPRFWDDTPTRQVTVEAVVVSRDAVAAVTPGSFGFVDRDGGLFPGTAVRPGDDAADSVVCPGERRQLWVRFEVPAHARPRHVQFYARPEAAPRTPGYLPLAAPIDSKSVSVIKAVAVPAANLAIAGYDLLAGMFNVLRWTREPHLPSGPPTPALLWDPGLRAVARPDRLPGEQAPAPAEAAKSGGLAVRGAKLEPFAGRGYLTPAPGRKAVTLTCEVANAGPAPVTVDDLPQAVGLATADGRRFGADPARSLALGRDQPKVLAAGQAVTLRLAFVVPADSGPLLVRCRDPWTGGAGPGWVRPADGR